MNNFLNFISHGLHSIQSTFSRFIVSIADSVLSHKMCFKNRVDDQASSLLGYKREINLSFQDGRVAIK